MNYDPNNSYNEENGNNADINNVPPKQNTQATGEQQGPWAQQQQQQNAWGQQQGQDAWGQQQSGWGQQQGAWQQPNGWSGQPGGWPPQNGAYYSPNPPPTVTNDASTSKTLGIVGLILALFCCPLAGLILGILAIARAKRAKQLCGGIEPPDATTGRICGIIAIIFAVLSMISTFITTIINIMLL